MASEFLDVPSEETFSSLLTKVSDGAENIAFDLNKTDVKVKAIKPSAAFCLKARNPCTNSKTFINICFCTELPEPPDIDEKELNDILKSNEPSSYRVPMSIGEVHEEMDKHGQLCACYDVVVNTRFFEKVEKSELFRSFLITLSFESVQEKYALDMQKDSCIVLKNKSYFGTMPDHFIREKPIIAELGSTPVQSCNEFLKTPVTPNKSFEDGMINSIVPKYILRKMPAFGHPKKMTLEVHLPNVSMGETVSVCVGEDRFVMYELVHKYSLDFFLPYLVIQPQCTAQFDVSLKVLHIVMPVLEDSREKNN